MLKPPRLARERPMIGYVTYLCLALALLLAGCTAPAPARPVPSSQHNAALDYGSGDTTLPSGWTPPPETPRPPPNSGTVVGTSPDGTYLVDEDGLSLYTFANDSPGNSTCAGGCAENWRPLAGERPLTQLDGAVAGNLSIIERDDGSTQIAYNDRPLYYFSGDSASGDRNGDGIGGVWRLAAP